jgi:hypothetical protein
VRYTAIYRSWLRSPPAAGAPDAVIGCYARVSSYAADVEAGEGDERVTRHRPIGRARLAGCRRWTQRAWLSSCDTTRAAVDRIVAAGLAHWDGDDLVIDGYDVWGQIRTARIREPARRAREDAPEDAGEDAPEDAGERAGLMRLSSPLPSSPLPTDTEEDPSLTQAGELRLIPDEPPNGMTEAAAIQAVFAHYRTHHPRACPNPKPKSVEWGKIKARLAEGSTVADLCSAIDGYHRDRWHVENGQLGLDLIVRDASHVAKGLQFLTVDAGKQAAKPPRQAAPIRLATVPAGKYAEDAARDSCDPLAILVGQLSSAKGLS